MSTFLWYLLHYLSFGFGVCACLDVCAWQRPDDSDYMDKFLGPLRHPFFAMTLGGLAFAWAFLALTLVILAQAYQSLVLHNWDYWKKKGWI